MSGLHRKKALKRETPLVAKTELQQRQQLKRSGYIETTNTSLRAGSYQPQVPAPRKPPKRGNGRGDAIPRDLADYIIERAEGCCDWCGRYCLNGWYSRQHRRPRGMGGSAGLNTAENLVLLCGSATSPGCHERCERSDLDAARDAGFRLRPGDAPETTPILRHGVSLVYPTANGWVPA